MKKPLRLLLVVSLLLFAGQARGQEFVVPDRKIVGADETVALGEMVDLAISPISEKPQYLTDTTYSWTVIDGGKEKRAKAVADSLFFGAGIVKKKVFVQCVITYLYAVMADGKITKVGIKTVKLTALVTIGDGDVPPPPPPPPPGPDLPDGQFKLARFAYDAVQTVPEGVRLKGAKALSTSFKGVLAAVAAGTVKDDVDLLSKTTATNNAAMKAAGVDMKDWLKFKTALQDKLWDLFSEGKLKGLDAYKTAWGEIVAGLEAVK